MRRFEQELTKIGSHVLRDVKAYARDGWIQPRSASDPKVMTKIVQPMIPVDLPPVILRERNLRPYRLDVVFGAHQINRDLSGTEDSKARVFIMEEWVTKDRMRCCIAIGYQRL